MREFSTIRVSVADEVATVTLARPRVKNAFDDVMLGELLEAYRELEGDPQVRVVVRVRHLALPSSDGVKQVGRLDILDRPEVTEAHRLDECPGRIQGLNATLRVATEVAVPLLGNPLSGNGLGQG